MIPIIGSRFAIFLSESPRTWRSEASARHLGSRKIDRLTIELSTCRGRDDPPPLNPAFARGGDHACPIQSLNAVIAFPLLMPGTI